MNHDLPSNNRRLIMSAKLLSLHSSNKHYSLQNNTTREHYQEEKLVTEPYQEQEDNAFYVLGYN
jgi:hypothetical protein